ncbi:hypothetical protein G6F46_014220 [Rhizopus delemar]|nr:hypothetical protein G6F46_014220 [Rhizopus delemar]
MTSLEYYLEALRDRRPGREDILDITRSSLEALRYWPLPDRNAVEPAPFAAQPVEPGRACGRHRAGAAAGLHFRSVTGRTRARGCRQPPDVRCAGLRRDRRRYRAAVVAGRRGGTAGLCRFQCARTRRPAMGSCAVPSGCRPARICR